MSRSLKAHLLLVLATLIWGSTFVVVKAALKFASPLVFTTIRMTVATIFLALFFHKSMRRISRPALVAGSAVGLLLFMGYALQTTALLILAGVLLSQLLGRASHLESEVAARSSPG